MTNDEIIEKMNVLLADHGGLDRSVKFNFKGDGQIHISGTEAVSEDKDADCTITLKKDDFMAMVKREMNPVGAFMSGRIKVSGDKSVAFGLQKLFS